MSVTDRPKVSFGRAQLELLRIGATGFGGPIALVAALERRFVATQIVTSHRFAEWLSICKLLPGPLATQMSIAMGAEVGGAVGGFVGGWVFLAPSFVMILLLSVGLSRFRQDPHLDTMLKALTAIAFGLVMQSVWELSRSYLKNTKAFMIAILAGVFVFWKPWVEPIAIIALGAMGAIVEPRNRSETRSEWAALVWRLGIAFCGITLLGAIEHRVVQAGDAPTLAGMYWILTKAGAWVYGSGLAILPVLQARLVDDLHWLSPEQFVDGLMIGQITPGPLVIAVVYYGWILFGLPGAVVAMLGMFGPAFFNILVLVPWVWRIWSKSPYAKGFQLWALSAVVGAVIASTGNLALRLNFGIIDWGMIAGMVALLTLVARRRLRRSKVHAAS